MLGEYGKRSNEDIIVNTFGRQLISLVQQSNLAITNGRKIGDLTGKITHVNPNGTSTVDYCITSLSLFSFILRFNVLDQQWYSDHNPLFSLKANLPIDTPDMNTNLTPIWKFRWNEHSKQKYMETISKKSSQKMLKQFTNTQHSDLNRALQCFTEIITDVGKASVTLINIKNINTVPSNTLVEENTKMLTSKKRGFIRVKRAFLSNKSNPNRRVEFIKAHSKYRRIKYYILNSEKENRIYKLAEIESSDPKLFWKSVKNILRDKMAPKLNISSTD